MEVVSLLYPDMKFADAQYCLPDFSFLEELHLEELLEINRNRFSLKPYFTTSADVIRYRQAILEDLMQWDGQDLDAILEMDTTVSDLRTNQKTATDIISHLYTVLEIEVYIDLVHLLQGHFQKYAVKSAGLSSLCGQIRAICEKEEFSKLESFVKEVRSSLKTVTSLTIGVNLDDNMRPSEAGLVRINSEPFRSGKMIDRFMSADFRKENAFRCLAPLAPIRKSISGADKRAWDMAFQNAMEEVIKASLRLWKPMVREYTDENTGHLLTVLQDIHFYISLIRYYRRFFKFSLTLPEISDADSEYRSLYHPILAAQENAPVTNSWKNEKSRQMQILTGPNRGGKSVYMKAVGINQALFQLGGYVHAAEAKLQICDSILVYLTKNNETSVGFGHLGEECNAIATALKNVGKRTLVLLDEPFSGTSGTDGVYLLAEEILALTDLGAHGIIITHIHEIYDYLYRYYEESMEQIGFLIAQMQDPTTGVRSYRIQPGIPDGKSYAADIAKRFGIERKAIVESSKR